MYKIKNEKILRCYYIKTLNFRTQKTINNNKTPEKTRREYLQ